MSDQAMKANAGKVRLSLLPAVALHDMARVREFGAAKYAAWDWTKGRAWSEYVDAMLRHLVAFNAGEDCDPESGLPHMAHVMCSAAFLLEFARTKPELDDRPKGQIVNPLTPGA